MKAYTDLEQSKKLAEILPIESADMFYYKDAVTKEDNPRVMNYSQVPKNKSMYYFPCWSLAALLNIIPVTAECKDMFLRLRIDKGPTGYDEYAIWYDDLTNLSTDIEAEADNFVDACYEFILKLHELKIL